MIASLKSERSRGWLAVASLLALITLFFGKLLFTNLILARGDTLFYIYPYWTAAAEALRAGRLPLWNPDLFMGAPLLANSQMGFLYPLNWPLWLLFDVPTAVTLSIVLHLALAAGFTYGLARRALGLGRPAAWLAAVLFALGGYLTAQVEHVNQMQGLAWLPAALCLLSSPVNGRRTLLLGVVFGMQLLAGHTQAAFITVIGASLFAASISAPDILQRWRRSTESAPLSLIRLPLTPVVVAGSIALLLAAAQLLPTLELSRYSMRGGGGLSLNEAVSFSLHPLLLGRALLPNYGETVFSEYVTYVPLAALLLALVGLWAGRRRPLVVGLGLLAGVGLFFALGAANPVYLLLAKLVPGFSYFRAPARWLVLYGLGTAGLAGLGLQAWLDHQPFPRRTLWLVWALGVTLLIIWACVAPQLTGRIPAPPESPVDPPSTITLVGWVIEVLIVSLLMLRPNKGWHPVTRYLLPIFGSTILIALFFASRALPYNHPSAPEAYHALRPALAHLKAATEFDHVMPPGRFLSISQNLFDPGDLGELQTIYGDRLDEDALADLITAIKQKEIVAPNLSLTFGLPAVDGYDGGVLPLANFVALEQLLLPPEAISMDGRLRENLQTIPPGRWLNLFNVRYVITDKVGDLWDQVNGVFYDLQFSVALDQSTPPIQVAYLPPFEATGLGLVISHLPVAAGTELVQVQVDFADGNSERLALTATNEGVVLRDDLDEMPWYATYLKWSTTAVPTSITLLPAPLTPVGCRVHGLSLVDQRDGAFQSLVVSGSGQYRLVYSGDVKIYENLSVTPRVFLVDKVVWAADTDVALALMSEPDFRPSTQAVLIGSGNGQTNLGGAEGGEVAVEDYRPERISLRVEAPADGWLMVSDTHYPGWEATVDGRPVVIERANVNFRAIPVEEGGQQVVMEYRPLSVKLGFVVSGVAVIGVLVGWFSTRPETNRLWSTVRRRTATVDPNN